MTPLPPPGPLDDSVIELRLIRTLGPDDADARSPESRFIANAPEYRFAIHRLTDGLRVGRIHLRITSDTTILRAVGHCGYAVHEEHRRNGYAVRALHLIRGLARRDGVAPLWILIAPDNIASRRTVERVGFRLVDVVDASVEALGLGLGSQLCRYAIDQP
jgi:predicted acetyltransferase